jgi:hypothetical protein
VPLARLSELAPAHQPSYFGVRRARSQVFDHSSWDMPVFEGFHIAMHSEYPSLFAL